MRDYGIVSPKFWTGDTGKQLRQDPQCQVLALYLMTSPHATMIGVYYCPIMYMAHETGLGMEGATKALARLIEMGFCTFHEASETVFVTNMAAYQIAEQLKADDKRVTGIRREVEKMPAGEIKSAFLATYSGAFHLVDEAAEARGSDAPSKALPSQKQDQEQEQEQEGKTSSSSSADKLPPCPHVALIDLFGKHLPELSQPKPELWKGTKADHMRARWRWVLTAKKRGGDRYATTEAEAVAFFDRFFAYVAKSDFLTGRKADWSCNLPWLMEEANFAKVIEGQYENKAAA